MYKFTKFTYNLNYNSTIFNYNVFKLISFTSLQNLQSFHVYKIYIQLQLQFKLQLYNLQLHVFNLISFTILQNLLKIYKFAKFTYNLH